MEWNEFRAKRKRFTSSVKQSEMRIRITPGTRDRLVGRLQQSTGCLKKSQNGRDDRQQEALLGYLGANDLISSFLVEERERALQT